MELVIHLVILSKTALMNPSQITIIILNQQLNNLHAPIDKAVLPTTQTSEIREPMPNQSQHDILGKAGKLNFKEENAACVLKPSGI